MLWLPVSLLSAFSLATTDAMIKRFFSGLSPYEMAMVRTLFTLPWLLISLFFIPLTRPDSAYFIVIAIAVPFEIVALYCYMKAIKISPLSLTVPFLAFTPAFVILTGRIALGESLNSTGIAGIILIVTGSYFLNTVKRTSLFFRILYGAWWFREKGTGERFLGAVIMLAGVFLIGFFS